MPLLSYGLLTGSLIDHGPQHGGNPHYLLLVQAGAIHYHVALNAETTPPHGDAPAALQFQIRNDLAGSKLARSIVNRGTFVLRDQDASRPSLDYIRDGVLDMGKFETLGHGQRRNPFYAQLVAAAVKAKNDTGAFVAVFGTGYPDQDDRPLGRGHNPLRAASGFSGIDNVHMNQGSPYKVGHHTDPAFRENGTHQDGAVLFFFSDKIVQGFFVKFQSQDVHTDDFGNPVRTGIDELDALTISPRARTQLLKNRPSATALLDAHTSQRRAKRKGRARSATSAHGGPAAPTAEIPVSGTSGGAEAPNPTFADTTTILDPNRPFNADDDTQYFNSPFVNNFAKYGTPEPVPSSRNGVYPILKLEDVIGARAIANIKAINKISFHSVGDTGAPTKEKFGNENTVAELMVRDFGSTVPDAEQPSFFFHLGDVVYYFGEEQYYYDQFYRPYKDYPRPILAIPGNHDGITHPNGPSSLEGFISAFCDDKPRYWKETGGILRSTMTQPGVYFTLDAPFVSIIGLYSNCSEHYGYLDDPQKLFLLSELKRLKPLRESGKITAILLAVHHSPMSFSARKPASVTMRADIDLACQQADLWPDAVLSGHAHIYQRMSRIVSINGKKCEIPHFVAGSGGFNTNPVMEIDKQDMKTQDLSDPEFRLHNFKVAYGYLLVTVALGSPPTLRVEFRSPQSNNGLPDDTCVLNLETHQLM